MRASPLLDLAPRLRGTGTGADDMAALAGTVCAVVAGHVPYAFACFATTDPASGLVTWAYKTHPLGVGDEEFAAAEYGPPDVNGFAEIAARHVPAGALVEDTGGRPTNCRRFREFLSPRFGFTDELRVVFRSRAVSWGALALYRGPGQAPFGPADVERVGETSELVADAVQQTLFRFTGAMPADGRSSRRARADGPAVLIVDATDRVTHISPAARAAIDELGGWEHGSLPANVLAVIARTRTRSEHVDSSTQLRSGRWLTLRAAPLLGGTGKGGDSAGGGDVVVTLEPTSPGTLSRLALVAHGLTAREEDVAVLVLQGASTRAIAAALHLSPHTVQDHLKQVFAKLGVTSRREMTARLVLA